MFQFDTIFITKFSHFTASYRRRPNVGCQNICVAILCIGFIMSSTMTEIVFTQWQRTQKFNSYLRPTTQGQLSDNQWFRIIGYRDHLTTLTSFHETHCLLVHFVPLYLGSKSRLHHRLSWKSLMCQPKYRFLLSFWNDKTAVSYNPVPL